MKTEILNQVDEAILSARVTEPFEYNALGEDESLQGKERQLHLSKRHNEQRKTHAMTIGQVTFPTEKGSFKVLDDKNHLKNFKAKINKDWKVKKPKSIKIKPLPSVKSCILRLVKDIEHRIEDSEAYHSNIFNADELHHGLIFYGIGSDYITPHIIDSKIKINGRNFVVVQGCSGWNILDELTAMSVIKQDQKVNKNTAINLAILNLKGFDFNHHKIKEAEKENTQQNLKKRFCELNNIELPMSLI